MTWCFNGLHLEVLFSSPTARGIGPVDTALLHGLKGDPGSEGKQGVMGPKGFRGEVGAEGPVGLAGRRGPAGNRIFEGNNDLYHKITDTY